MEQNMAKEIEQTIYDMIVIQLSSKFWHWITTSYAEHDAADYLNSKISKKLDTIVESYQSVYNKRIVIPSNINMISYNTRMEKIDELIGILNRLVIDIKKEDLKNLFTEVITILNVFKYKSTLS